MVKVMACSLLGGNRLLSLGTLGTKFSEISIKIKNCPLKKAHLKMLSARCQPFYICFNVLNCDFVLGAHVATAYHSPR